MNESTLELVEKYNDVISTIAETFVRYDEMLRALEESKSSTSIESRWCRQQFSSYPQIMDNENLIYSDYCIVYERGVKRYRALISNKMCANY